MDSQNIIENFKYVFKLFNDYYADGKFFVLFIIAIFINLALIKKEEKKQKTLLVYLPLTLILICLGICPIIIKIIDKFMAQGVYWRFFWMFPIAPVVAYAFVRLIKSKEKNIAKIILSIGSIFIIVFSGKYMFSITNYQKVGNVYKCPDDILNAIMIMSSQEKEDKKAMIPISVVPWVRQYDATIAIEYDRSPGGTYSKFVSDYEAGNAKDNMKKFLDDGCNFFVVYRGGDYNVNFEDYGFVKVGENNSYIVYMLEE